MKVRCVPFAYVCSAWFAASVAISGVAYASPEEQIATVSQAYKALGKGDPASSIPLFTAAIESRELPPENLANALLNRAQAYQIGGQHQPAINDYTAALNLDAMSPQLRATALYNRGLSQQKLSLATEAVEDFTNALLLNPTLPQAFLSRGISLRDAGQLLFAIADFQRALRNEHPDPARVHFALAETYIELKRTDEARQELANTLKLRPDHAKAKAHLERLGTAMLKIEEVTDPVLTGSTANIEKELPRAIEPPAELLVEAPVKEAAVTKVYQDRLPKVSVEDQQTAEIVVPEDAFEAAAAKAVGLGAQENTAQVAEAEIEADPMVTASVSAIESVSPTAKPIADPVVEVAPPQKKKVARQVVAAVEESEEISDENPSPAAAAWVVQLTSAASENAAWSSWKKLKAKHKLSSDMEPVVVRADLGAKGIFYRLRLNFDAQSEAKSSCKKLTAKGLSCFVSKG